MNRRVASYVASGRRKVEGWSPKLAFMLISEVAEIQKKQNCTGPVCEIGVHHGQLLILLHLCTSGMEKTIGYDLFEPQQPYPYPSGKGNKDVVEPHLQAFGCDRSRITLQKTNSLDLTPEQIVSECGAHPRLFSIDGGHTTEVVFNDLTLAKQSISSQGVVILDDLFSEPFPEVGEGFYQFMREEGGLFPFLIGGNKIFLARSEAVADQYLKALSTDRRRYETRVTRFCGRQVMVVLKPYYPVKNALRRSAFWQNLRGTLAGTLVRKMMGKS